MAEPFDTLFKRAITIAGGSEAKLASAAGCSQNAIWSAKRVGRVSPEMAIRIETATKGVVGREALRPDLWPPKGDRHGTARHDRGGVTL